MFGCSIPKVISPVVSVPLQTGGLPDHFPSALQVLCSDPPDR